MLVAALVILRRPQQRKSTISKPIALSEFGTAVQEIGDFFPSPTTVMVFGGYLVMKIVIGVCAVCLIEQG